MPNFYNDFKDRFNVIFTEYSSASEVTYMRQDGSNEVIAFGEVKNIVAIWGKELKIFGLCEGNRVAIIGSASTNVVLAIYALAISNITAVMIDPALPSEEIIRLLNSSDVSAAFVSNKLFELLPNELKSSMPIFNTDNKKYELERFPQSGNAPRTAAYSVGGTEIITILFSSGTSSAMKGVMVTYQSMLRAQNKQEYTFGIKAGDKYLVALPLHHMAGYSSMMSFMLTGCKIAVVENLNSVKLQRAFQEYNPNYFGMVPKVYDAIASKINQEISNRGCFISGTLNGLLKFSGFVRKIFGLKIGRVLFKSIYSKVFGKQIVGLAVMGSICKPSTSKLFLNLGLNWANVYGSTEGNAPICSTGVYDKYAFDSVGKINQFDDIEIKIHSPNNENIGEIYIKTPMIMKGYFCDPSATAAAFDGDFFKTGDLGFVDKNNYLHITGRVKETIALRNGEKVSAPDVDAFYQSACPEVKIACCAVTTDEGCDEIHLFIERLGKSDAEVKCTAELLKRKSLENNSIYSVAGIHIVEKIPETSIGKTKRYLLLNQIKPNESCQDTTTSENNSIDEIILKIIASHTSLVGNKMDRNYNLTNDLGLDSLAIFEIVTEIYSRFNIDVSTDFESIKTVGELINSVQNSNNSTRKSNISEYPLHRNTKDIKSLKRLLKKCRSTYTLQVAGLENVPSGNYILCSNHINNLDPIWLLAAMNEVDYNKIGCLAAVHLFKNKFSRNLLKKVGAIPVDRSGNTSTALKRCKECLCNGYSLIIFPEGARSRDGSMLTFKNGPSTLSVETGTPILPARIDGGFEIFPRHKKFPRRYDFKNKCKFTLKVTFGRPIYPNGRSAKEITKTLRETIDNL